MKRTVDGDCIPTFRRIGRRLIRMAKWTGKALLVLLVVLAIAHGIATFITGRKLEADIRALKASGETLSITELVGPKVPDAENAALVYAEAFALLPSPEADSREFDQLSEFADAEKRKSDPGRWDRARAVVHNYDQALETAERAASMEKCRFPVKWEDGFAAMFPHYRSLRQLAQLANARGLIAARDGRMDEAARFMALSLRIADSTEDEPTLISVLVRAAIIRMTCRNLQDVAAYGSLSDEQTERLSGLLAEADLRPHYRLAMQGERAVGVTAFRQIHLDPGLFFETLSQGGVASANPKVPRLLVTVLKPVLYADERFYLRHMNRVVADADKPITESDMKDLDDSVHSILRPVTSMLLPAFGRVKSRVYEGLAETRITRIGLELKSYRHRHGGYPDSLGRLGLADTEMLEDPFSANSIIYKRQAKGFILYSVGPDMKDDGGKPPADVPGESPKGDIVGLVN